MTVTAPQVSEPTDLSLQVTVTDSFGNQASDTATISVSPAATQNRNQSGSGGGGAIQSFILLVLTGVAMIRRIRRDTTRQR